MNSVRRGFTLIEVLTVITIIGILTTLTTYAYNSSLTRSRDSQRLTDLKSIQNTLEQYYLDTRSYPNYKYTSPFNLETGYPHVAKFQLEKFVNNSWPNCDQTDLAKTYLAPKYITTIPEDPLHKLKLNNNCQVAGSSPAGAYQYHYVPFMAADDMSVPVTRGYYLMAKMERKNNAVLKLKNIRDSLVGTEYNFTRQVINLPGDGIESGNGPRAWPGLPYRYCSQQIADPTTPNCHINYFLSNKDR